MFSHFRQNKHAFVLEVTLAGGCDCGRFPSETSTLKAPFVSEKRQRQWRPVLPKPSMVKGQFFGSRFWILFLNRVSFVPLSFPLGTGYHEFLSLLFFFLKSLLLQVASFVSDSVRPHRRQPTRPHRPWDSPGKNTGVGCHFLLQCMKVKSESEVAQSCLTLGDPMDCSLPGSSIHGIFQARVLEWGAIAFSCRPTLKHNEALHFTKDPMLGCHSRAHVKDSKCLLSVSVPSCYCSQPPTL